MASQPLIINSWQDGIAPSPHIGNGLLRNLDIVTFPGALKVAKKPITLFHTAYAGTFTADASTDVCTTATAPESKAPVRLTTTGTLPAGLALATDYFVINVSGTTFKLATTWENARTGTPIDITDAGTGVHTITTTNPGTVNHIIKRSNGGVFALDSNSRLWYKYLDQSHFALVKGNTLTNGSGKGLAYFDASDGTSYAFVFRNATIDVVNAGSSLTTTPSWTSGWKSLNTGSSTANSHHAITGQDNIIYFCDAKYVGSIIETSGDAFDPSDAASYTYNSQALDLPNAEVAEWLDELGVNLMVAGSTFNKIYPWDRASDSFNLPILVPEQSIKKIKTIAGVIYILAGSKGKIYSSLGVSAKEFVTLPTYVTNNADTLQFTMVTWGGITDVNGSLLVGASVIASGNSGVYMITPDGKITIDAVPSTGSANVTALMAGPEYASYGANEYYFLGYASGADIIDVNRYAAATYAGVFHSSFNEVATKTEKATFSKLEVVLAKPATTGNVRVSYRVDTSSSFTTLDTFAADSTNTMFQNDSIGLIDIENIQVQLEIDGAVEVREVRLIP